MYPNISLICADTILEIFIIGGVRMPGKAKQYVVQSISSVQTTLNTLQYALNSAERQDNKNKIQQAINSLNRVQLELTDFQD